MSLCFPQRDVYPVYLLVPEGVAWGAGFSEHPLFYRRGDSVPREGGTEETFAGKLPD